ncbi:hypothetical protein N7499_009479 [Penicillium canescens]|nr:hypothetical protein N7499_009479 [Penicillium canescens]
MSAPTRQFHKLCIGQNMPDTAQVRPRAGPPDPSDDSDQGSEASSEGSSGGESTDEDESESTHEAVRAPSGITYDLGELESESQARALVGLTSHFEVNCRVTPTGHDLQLLDRPQVHVGSEATTCTCSVFKDHPEEPCQHIFWLLDQLHGCFLEKPESTEVALASDGRPHNLPPIEGLLKGNLEAVAKHLKWQYLRDEGNSTGRGMTRTEKVRDILSAFSKKTLPEDFRQDLTETTEQARTAEACVVQGDFEATMFRLGVHDDGVFNSLCKAMPVEACAAIYFDKAKEHSRRLLDDFDRYCQTGELPAEPVGPSLGLFEPHEIVSQLQRLVFRIITNMSARAPHSSEAAVEALVSVLDSVAGRNYDPLLGNRLGRDSFNGEDEDQRNLFHLLIGSDELESDPDARHFVLSALDELPPSDLHPVAGPLRGILNKIGPERRAPKLFRLHLESLVRIAESYVPDTTTGGQKRPAGNGNSGGNSKRTR